MRLVWLFPAQFGWRPSHATGVRWSDIRYDEQGRPSEILAWGKDGEFKTYAPVAVHLWPDVIKALEEWRKLHPNPNGNAWILPFRGLTGKLEARKMKTCQYRAHWESLQKKYALPRLRAKDLRHWVSTACRKVGLSKVARSYLQGHDANTGSFMGDTYDNPQLEDIFLEQVTKLPNGPLGTLVPLKVELVSDIPSEGLSLLRRYLAGEIGIMSLMTAVEGIKMKLETKPSGPIT